MHTDLAGDFFIIWFIYFIIFFAHTLLVAYGINLPTAQRIYFMDLVWEPSKEKQAIKRAHRIGQTKSVFVEKLIMKDTIEEQFLTLRNRINQLSQSNTENGSF